MIDGLSCYVPSDALETPAQTFEGSSGPLLDFEEEDGCFDPTEDPFSLESFEGRIDRYDPSTPVRVLIPRRSTKPLVFEVPLGMLTGFRSELTPEQRFELACQIPAACNLPLSLVDSDQVPVVTCLESFLVQRRLVLVDPDDSTRVLLLKEDDLPSSGLSPDDQEIVLAVCHQESLEKAAASLSFQLSDTRTCARNAKALRDLFGSRHFPVFVSVGVVVIPPIKRFTNTLIYTREAFEEILAVLKIRDSQREEARVVDGNAMRVCDAVRELNRSSERLVRDNVGVVRELVHRRLDPWKRLSIPDPLDPGETLTLTREQFEKALKRMPKRYDDQKHFLRGHYLEERYVKDLCRPGESVASGLEYLKRGRKNLCRFLDNYSIEVRWARGDTEFEQITRLDFIRLMRKKKDQPFTKDEIRLLKSRISEELSHEEGAKELDVPLHTYKKTLLAARRKLHAHLRKRREPKAA